MAPSTESPTANAPRQPALLVINAGSSSIKFAVFAAPEPAARSADGVRNDSLGAPSVLTRGRIAVVAAGVELRIEDAAGAVLDASHWAPAVGGAFDHAAALHRLFAWLDAHQGGLALLAVGHRVVHGGARFEAPVVVDAAVLRGLDALVPLAPLHQPHGLAAIHAVASRWPGVPQVACFDTAFHHTQPAVARAFALPREITEAGVHRYGFHGLSFEYIADQLPRVFAARQTGAARRRKVIVAHLGNGASLCALVDGRSVASTMGFSVLDGLVMGTRCGALDAGVVLYLQQHLGKTVQQVSTLLYEQSGLLGVSCISSDMQVLLASSDARALEAIDLFVYRAAVEIGAMAAAMGGLDALVFTGGVGENAAAVRQRICAACAWLGAVLDDTANSIDLELIHAASSTMALAVVPTDEGLMIARHTVRALPHLFEATSVQHDR